MHSPCDSARNVAYPAIPNSAATNHANAIEICVTFSHRSSVASRIEWYTRNVLWWHIKAIHQNKQRHAIRCRIGYSCYFYNAASIQINIQFVCGGWFGVYVYFVNVKCALSKYHLPNAIIPVAGIKSTLANLHEPSTLGLHIQISQNNFYFEIPSEKMILNGFGKRISLEIIRRK